MPNKPRKTRFVKEFKRQVRLAVAAAIGFVIAFAWKDTIVKIVGEYYSNLGKVMPIGSSILTSLTISLIGVLLILLSSRLLE